MDMTVPPRHRTRKRTRTQHRPRREDRSVRRQHGSWAKTMLAVLVVLITYGSLYPFDYVEPASFATAWRHFTHDWSMVTSRGDALGNVLLFLPFGFTGVYACKSRRAAAVFSFVVCALLFAALLQVIQIYFPARTPAMGDVGWNALGLFAGVAAGLVLRSGTRHAHLDWRVEATVPLTLVALWVCAELMPLVPTIDLQHVKDSVKALLQLDLHAPDILWHAAGVMLAAPALAAVCGRRAAAGWLAALVAAIAFGKLIVVTRVLTASTVAGLALGLAAALAALRRPAGADGIALVTLVLAYTAKALFPFAIAPVATPFNWVPFGGMLEGSMLTNAQVLAESVFAYAGVLGLVRMNGSRIGTTAVLLALWVAAIEAVQTCLVGRTPDITEPLLVLLVAVVLNALPGPQRRIRR